MLRFSFLVIILTAVSVIADLASEIEAFTGGRTKFIWARGVGGNNDADLSNANYELMGYDTHDGHERVLVPGPISCANPWITPDGQRIVFTSWPDTQIYIADWSGMNLRPLLKGYGLYVWNDPATNREWIYYSDYPYGTVIYRCEIDSLSHQEPVWNKSQVSIRFRVSADGSHGGGEFPWPDAGEAILPNDSFLQYGSGCNSQIAPDNSYRFFVLKSEHQDLLFCDSGKTNCREIPVSSILDFPASNTIWAPKWSNDPGYITCVVDETQDIYLGKFNESFTAIRQWIRITNNIDTFDNYAYAWIGLPSYMSFSPDSIFFNLDSNGQGVTTGTVQISNIHGTLPPLSASTTAPWLTLQVKGQYNGQSVLNTVSSAALPSGIYSSTVTVSGPGIPSEQYTITLRIDGSPKPSSIAITPPDPLLPCSSSVQFAAQVFDQFHNSLDGSVVWQNVSGGTISDNGLFQSNGSVGRFMIRACDPGSATLCARTFVTVYKNLIVTSPSKDMIFHAWDTLHVRWTGKPPNIQGAVVSLSLNNGRTWTQINDRLAIGVNDADWGNFAWVITDSILTDEGNQPCISDQCKIKVADYNRGPNSDYFSNGLFAITDRDLKSFRRPMNNQVRGMKIGVQGKRIMLKASSSILSVDVYNIRGVCVAKYRSPQNKAINKASLRLSRGLFLVKAKTSDRAFAFRCIIP